MSIFTMYKTDDKVETEGVELNYGDNGHKEDTIIKVARAGGSNKDYQKAMTKALRPVQKQIQTQTLTDEAFNKIRLQVFLKTIIKGGSGLVDAEGKKLDFTPENVEAVLTALPDLFLDIVEQASNPALFRLDITEDAAKN